MVNSRAFIAISLFFLVSSVGVQAHSALPLVKPEKDLEFNFGGYYKPESFYGKNVSLLNSNNKTDKQFFARHSLDFNASVIYGLHTYNERIAEFYFTLRNKGVWGNEESIAKTTTKQLKDVNVVESGHNHAIPRHILWAREIWLEFTINRVLGLSFDNKHTFQIGLFPFDLGRGIALGSAYAVGPEVLGFYTPDSVDQYAPGAKFSGDIVSDVLAYDLYAAILNNQADTTRRTAAKIRGQEFGRLNTPERGFGKINYLIAGRCLWNVFKTSDQRIVLEPYWMFNDEPEQKIEFLADASSKLGTIGFACEYAGPRFEFGFDWARNFGRQKVRGWDRNHVIKKNVNGFHVEVNSHVKDQNGNNIPFTGSSSDAQNQINALELGQPQNVCNREPLNGQKIGSVSGGIGNLEGDVDLINADNRYRDPYENTYKGWMVVADAAYYFLDRDLRIAAGGGAASGDLNPNEETIDGDYKGFIGLQEIYSGSRIKSAFLFGGAGRINRPLDQPTSNQAINSPFPSQIGGFTNVIFSGASAQWKPSNWSRKCTFHPNVIGFWQHKDTKKFDAATQTELCEPARSYLGTEVNLFFDCYLLDSLKLFFVGSVFFPGGHYTDIKGIPINSDQQRALDRLDQTGFDETLIPNLGDDVAMTFNLGLQYYF